MSERNFEEKANLQTEKSELIRKGPTMSEHDVYEGHTSVLFENGRPVDNLYPEDKWFTGIMMTLCVILLIAYIVFYVFYNH